MTTANTRLTRPTAKKAATDPAIAEILKITGEIQKHIRTGCWLAIKVGLRLMHIHKTTGDTDEPGGFRAALAALDGCDIPRSTAYRWINAASAAVMRLQGIEDPELIELPKIGSAKWDSMETKIEQSTQGISLRRLLIGSAAPASDEARLDNLITAAESGDPNADEFLERVASGEMTLVQAIRAQAGAKATKSKTRKDPVYLDIDSASGEPTGLVPKCLITLSRAFATWNDLDETARKKVRTAWKALVADLPRDLR